MSPNMDLDPEGWQPNSRSRNQQDVIYHHFKRRMGVSGCKRVKRKPGPYLEKAPSGRECARCAAAHAPRITS